MKDVATAAGVSPSTVSRILNDAPLMIPVTAQTRARVIEAASRLGYLPNRRDEDPRRARRMQFGAIVTDMANPLLAGYVDALVAEARARGYNVVLGQGETQAGDSQLLAPPLDASRVDAIFMLGDPRHGGRVRGWLPDKEVPVVSLWPRPDHPGLSSASADQQAGIEDAVVHLTGLGHRRIAFVGSASAEAGIQRDAFRTAVARARLGYRCAREADDTVAGGSDAIQALLAETPSPTAVVASSDIIAAGVVRGAAERGVPVPAALSVVGYGDIQLAASLVPALTTVRLPVAAIAAAAVEIAVEQAAQPPEVRTPRNVVFRPWLVVRESTAPARVP